MALADQTTTAQLNSFSIGSVLGSIWDTTKNTFTNAIHNVENAALSAGLAAQARATADARNSQQASYAIPISAGLSNTTMLFLGGALVLFLFSRK